jgi:hypothetical protein
MKFDIYFWKSVEKIQFHSNLTRITGTLYEDQYTFMIISLPVLLRMGNIWDKLWRKNTIYIQKLFFFFRKPCRLLWDNVEKLWRECRPQMKIWCMRIACWIPKAADTHSEYVILITFPHKQWFHERSSTLRYSYFACLVIFLSFFFFLLYYVFGSDTPSDSTFNNLK